MAEAKAVFTKEMFQEELNNLIEKAQNNNLYVKDMICELEITKITLIMCMTEELSAQIRRDCDGWGKPCRGYPVILSTCDPTGTDNIT